MTDIKKPELNFLWEISNVLAKKTDEQELIDELKTVFHR